MHHYDDPNYNYQLYWKNRDYEHQSELLAIQKLLDGKTFHKIADLGGGFGRLFPLLSQYSKQVVLLEPSLKLRTIAKKSYPNLTVRHSFSHHIPYRANTFDLINMVRVSHHLTNLALTLLEVYRVLKPNGYFLLEIANSAHFKARFTQHFFIPKIPIERRSPANIRRQTIAFVNHHPQTVIHQLISSGFTIEKILSVSNFRSPLIKKLIPQKILLVIESALQPLLSSFYFGPSIFVFAKKGIIKPHVDN